MADKIRVWNKTQHDVGIKFMDGLRELNMKPNTFLDLSSDEVYILNSTTTLFTDKHLCVEVEKSDSVAVDNLYVDVGILKGYTDEDYKAILKGKVDKLKMFISENNIPHIQAKLIEIARTLDLPASKIKVLEEMTGMKVILSEE